MASVVIATWIAKEGEEETVAAAIEELGPASRNEPGNLVYEPHRSPDNPRMFVFYEKYVDEDAIRAHAESDHFKRLAIDHAIPRLEVRERIFLTDW
jgi:quinol monooxygenase YgiN